MGLDLRSDAAFGGGLSLSYGGWAMILDLACRYGWQPRGTEAPKGVDSPDEWSGEYCSSDGQSVTVDDANALATALAAAVADPNLRETLGKMDAEQRREVAERSGVELATTYAGIRDVEEFVDHLEEVSSFCRQGPFRIE